MKAAQVSGGTNNNGTPGGHSGLLGSSANLSSTSPGPAGQNMMQGKSYLLSQNKTVNNANREKPGKKHRKIIKL